MGDLGIIIYIASEIHAIQDMRDAYLQTGGTHEISFWGLRVI